MEAWRHGDARRLLAGRDTDLTVLHHALGAASGGHGGAVVVTGEPGIGKSALVGRLAEEARDSGWDVGWGSGWDSSPRPPYRPWRQALGSAPGIELDLLPARSSSGADDPGVPSDAAGGAASHHAAVVEHLRRVTRAHPRLLVLEDLHWFDADSVALLAHLLPELSTSPLLMVCTVRDLEVEEDSPLGAVLGTLVRAGRSLPLHGLDQSALAELVTGLTGQPLDGRAAVAVKRWTGGNPLFVREMVRLLMSEGRLSALADGEPTLSVPSTVRAVLDQRLGGLSDVARVTLATLAVVGDGSPLPLLAEVGGLGEEVVRQGVSEAVGVRLLTEDLPPRFPHDLVREAVRTGTSPEQRAELHRRAAEAAPRWHGQDPGRHAAVVAAHLSAAGDEQGALPYRLIAARAAIVDAAWHEAADQLRRARETVSTPSVDLLLSLGEALGGCGDSDAAREVYLEAADLARAVGDAEKFARAALGYGAGLAGFEVSLFDIAQQQLLDEALERLPSADSSLRSWILGRLSVALSFTADHQRRLEIAEAAVAMARRVGDGAALARALASWCDAVAGPEDTERRLAATDEMERAARAARDPVHVLLARRFRIVALLEQGNVARARKEAVAFAKDAQQLRHPTISWYVPLFRGVFAMIDDRPEETLAAAREVLEAGRRTGSTNATALGMTQQLGCLLLQERYDEIAAMLDDDVLPPPEYEPTPSVRPSLALVNLLTGRRDLARAELDRAVSERFGALPPHDSEWVGSLCSYVRVSSALGHPEAASQLHDLLAPYRHRFVVDGIAAGFWGSVSLWAGEAAEAAGRYADARELFEQSLDEHRRIAAPALVATSAAALDRLAPPIAPPSVRHPVRPSAPGDESPVFRREGDGWRIAYAGNGAVLRDSKGLQDLAVLLGRPGQQVHVMELANAGSTGSHHAAGDLSVEGDLGPVLDRRAAADYRRRLGELEQELQEAESDADLDLATNLRLEKEAIRSELSAAFGLGGRARRPSHPAERARKAVSGRIRDAISRIGAVHPELGRHLAASVRTGSFCSYDPERSVTWQV